MVGLAQHVVFPELLRIWSASAFLAIPGFLAPVQRVLGNFAVQLPRVSGGGARAPQGKLVLIIETTIAILEKAPYLSPLRSP